jgi:hypothetical protein
MEEEFKLFFNTNFSINNISYSIDRIIQVIKEKCANNEFDSLKDIILNQHNFIFNYDNLINKNLELIQELFTNRKFLPFFNDICGLINFSESEIIFINKIIYDYFEVNVYNNTININEIRQFLLSISYIINDDRIRKLTPILGVNIARILSIVSYSSFKIKKVVHRINEFVVNNLGHLDHSYLKIIYNILFYYPLLENTEYNDADRKKIINLFIFSMMENYNQYDNTEYTTSFNKLSSIIFDILLNVDSGTLLELLKQYGTTISIFNINKETLRFNIKDILHNLLSNKIPGNYKLKPEVADKYIIIRNTIDYIEKNYNIIIP